MQLCCSISITQSRTVSALELSELPVYYVCFVDIFMYRDFTRLKSFMISSYFCVKSDFMQIFGELHVVYAV